MMGTAMNVNVYTAKAQLSRLIDRVLAGEEVVITRHGRAVARLVGAREEAGPRPLGLLRGRIRIADDFDAPLPEDVLADFEGAG